MPFPARVILARNDIPEVFQGNTQNILQKNVASGMIGLLMQLNKVSAYASEIFNEVLADSESTSRRLKKCRRRIAKLGGRVPEFERLFVKNTPNCFYDHPNGKKEYLRNDTPHGQLFTRDSCTKAVNYRRSRAEKVPDFSMMDYLAVDENTQCNEKFSNPDFFFNEWLAAEKKKLEEEKRIRKAKRAAARSKRVKRRATKKIATVQKKKYNAMGAEFESATSHNGNSSQELKDVKQYELKDIHFGERFSRRPSKQSHQQKKKKTSSKSSQLLPPPVPPPQMRNCNSNNSNSNSNGTAAAVRPPPLPAILSNKCNDANNTNNNPLLASADLQRRQSPFNRNQSPAMRLGLSADADAGDDAVVLSMPTNIGNSNGSGSGGGSGGQSSRRRKKPMRAFLSDISNGNVGLLKTPSSPITRQDRKMDTRAQVMSQIKMGLKLRSVERHRSKTGGDGKDNYGARKPDKTTAIFQVMARRKYLVDSSADDSDSDSWGSESE